MNKYALKGLHFMTALSLLGSSMLEVENDGLKIHAPLRKQASYD